MKKNILAAVLFAFAVFFAFPQEPDDKDDFNFDEAETNQENNFSIHAGGSLYAGINFSFSDFKNLKNYQPGLPVWGNLHIEAKAPLTEAYFGIVVSDKTIPQIALVEKTVMSAEPIIPSWIGEAYMQVIAGQAVFGGGVKKMTWGKADAMSVLDVLNPHDYTDFSELDNEKTKIPQPMFYLSAYLPLEMKLDFVYLPIFEPHRAALSGRWQSMDIASNLKDIPQEIMQILQTDGFTAAKISENAITKLKNVKTNTLNYSQGGARYTVTIDGAHDLGMQYFCGFFPIPAVKFDSPIDVNHITEQGKAAFNAAIAEGKDFNEAMSIAQTESYKAAAPLLKTMFDSISFVYNRYHQIGIDYGTAIGPVNLRTEFAANITSDLEGNNPYIYNPNLAWNIGLDYTMPFNISINIQAMETIKLRSKKIGKGSYSFDIEKTAKITDTRLIFILSQRLVRGSLEWKIIAVTGIEDADFMIAPGVHWQFGTLLLDADLGFFGGKKTGKLGRYGDNHFIKLSVGYTF